MKQKSKAHLCIFVVQNFKHVKSFPTAYRTRNIHYAYQIPIPNHFIIVYYTQRQAATTPVRDFIILEWGHKKPEYKIQNELYCSLLIWLSFGGNVTH